MKLTDLLPSHTGSFNPVITSVTADSRAVTEGSLFIALSGSKDDGSKYIADALSKGAAAVIAEAGAAANDKIITVENARKALSDIASRFYPAQPATIAAVTGTNGKTSSAEFTRQLWDAAGVNAASLGTLGLRAKGQETSGAMTTPDPITLHAILSDLAASGITHLAMEASSHGLDQYRLDGVKVQAAGFTNLTHDHLDYHKSFAHYLAAKTRLFSAVVDAGGTAVINADVPEFEALAKASHERGVRVISYGRKGTDLQLLSRTPTPRGQDIRLGISGKTYDLSLPLVGAFQVMNALCALGMVMATTGKDASFFIPALENLQGVPGRLQYVPGHALGAVYVDYAHTPDALDNILDALRPHVTGRLICLVGCGGDRDPLKRPVMGRIAAEKADLVIVTDDNPRTEDAASIRAAVMAGATGATEIAGRADAIRFAVSQIQEGDILVLAGKGHEQGQIIGTEIHPFDDVIEAEKAIQFNTKTVGV